MVDLTDNHARIAIVVLNDDKKQDLHLRACPWCGSIPAIYKITDLTDPENYKVQCNNPMCNVLVKTFYYDSPEKAVSIWNGYKCDPKPEFTKSTNQVK